MRHRKKTCSGMILAFLVLGIPHEAAPQAVRAASPLRVGAAKVDVTPAEGELPKNSRGVLDRLYARAIVLESGRLERCADHGGRRQRLPIRSGRPATRQIEAELGIPTSNVLLTATHTHSAGGQRGPDYAREDRRVGSPGAAEAHAGSGGLRHWRVVHQRQPPDHRSRDAPVVGGSRTARARPTRPWRCSGSRA